MRHNLNKIRHFSTQVVISLSNRHDKTDIAHCKLLSGQRALDQSRLQISTSDPQGSSKLLIRRLTP